MPQYKILLNRSATAANHPPSGSEYTIILAGSVFTDSDNEADYDFPEISIFTTWNVTTPYDKNTEDASWIHNSPAGFVSTVTLTSPPSDTTTEESNNDRRRRSLRSQLQPKTPVPEGETVYITNSMTAFISYFASAVLPKSNNLNVEWSVDTGRGPEWKDKDGVFVVDEGDMAVFKDTTLEELLEDVEGIVEVEEKMAKERREKLAAAGKGDTSEGRRKRKRGVDSEDEAEGKRAKSARTMERDQAEEVPEENLFDRLKKIVDEGMKKVASNSAGHANQVANEDEVEREDSTGRTTRGNIGIDKGNKKQDKSKKKQTRINFAR